MARAQEVRPSPRPEGSRKCLCPPASPWFRFSSHLRIGASYLKMTESDVRALALAGESETVEFKRTTGQLSRAAEALCAFLNAHGGQVLFGVDDLIPLLLPVPEGLAKV